MVKVDGKQRHCHKIDKFKQVKLLNEIPDRSTLFTLINFKNAFGGLELQG